jgi:hypothetical protein
MLINDFGQRPAFSDESVFEDVRGPKRPFLLIHCGDGFRPVMAERRCRAEAVVWVLSARCARDETLVNDVLRANYLGARAVLVFITDVDDPRSAHECERFARETLSRYALQGDERTVLFATGPMSASADRIGWREGISQLFDALEREAPFPDATTRPMAIVIGGRTRSEQVIVGGFVRGEPVVLGMEVELPVLAKRARVVMLTQPGGPPLEQIDVGRWAKVTLEGVSVAEIERETVLTRPGAARLVRSCVGRVCELNDEAVPPRVFVRGNATSATAAIEWLDERYMIPRRAKLVFEQPTAWIDDNYAVLHDLRSRNASNDTLLWLATFDAELEPA